MIRYWPLSRGKFTLSSPFGQRPGGFHAGQDFAADSGTPIYACAGGTVLHIGPAEGYGQWIVIDHPTADGGGVTEYGHMWDAAATGLTVGDRIEAGQLIAYVGSNGQSTGPHLHLSVMPHEYNPDSKVDPMAWLDGARYPTLPALQPSPGGSTMRELDWTAGGVNSSGRYGSAVRLFVLHTQEGDGTAESLARYLQNPNSGVSYHYTGDDDTIVDVVDTDRASWSVLDANPYTINACFAGSRTSQSRKEWLDQFSNTIDAFARLFVQDAAKYNPLVPAVIDYADVSRGRAGGTDHRGITVGLRIGDHTDVGPNFPWDVFAARVDAHAKGVDIPVVVNMIDAQAAASPWLGARLTVGERPCPDGRGRWVQFEHGHIYWTPTTGARPIPVNVFETWADLGFEAGPLGYPVNYHTVLPVEGDPKVGDAQAFEGGAIYRRYGQPGYWVHGAIGERWKREGFETSRWGWPVSNETTFPGGAEQTFEGGRITWSADNTLGLIPTDGPDEIVPATPH